jgi:hypothetical protein
MVKPADRASLVRDLVTKAGGSVALARAVLAAAERVSAVAEAAPSAKVPDLTGLRRALNDLDMARRSLEAGLNDAGEVADCLLDAFEARTRHIRR